MPAPVGQRIGNMLRAIVVMLAVMACVKVGTQVYFYRSATNDIIVDTYRAAAIAACARHGMQGPLRVPAAAWSQPASVQLTIGKRDLDVYLWQVNHRLWNARFRHPFLVITADAETAHIYCEYDIVRAFAAVHRL